MQPRTAANFDRDIGSNEAALRAALPLRYLSALPARFRSPIAIACFRLVTFPLTTLAGFQYFLLASPYRAFNRLTGCLAVLAV